MTTPQGVEAPTGDYCWLVELFHRGGNSLGRYHTGFTDLHNQSRSTADPYQAKRYYAKENAEQVATDLNVHMMACEWRAIEHGFCAAVPASPVQPLWRSTQFHYPTDDDFEPGVVVAFQGRGSDDWFVKTLHSPRSNFAMVAFGSPPRYWTRADALMALAASPVQPEPPEAGSMQDFDDAAALVDRLRGCETNGQMLAAVLAYRKTIRTAHPSPPVQPQSVQQGRLSHAPSTACAEKQPLSDEQITLAAHGVSIKESSRVSLSFLREFTRAIQATKPSNAISEMVASTEPIAGTDALYRAALAEIQQHIEVMLASATTLGGEWVEGYQIKTGALHKIIGAMQWAGFPVTVPLPTAEAAHGITAEHGTALPHGDLTRGDPA